MVTNIQHWISNILPKKNCIYHSWIVYNQSFFARAHLPLQDLLTLNRSASGLLQHTLRFWLILDPLIRRRCVGYLYPCDNFSRKSMVTIGLGISVPNIHCLRVKVKNRWPKISKLGQLHYLLMVTPSAPRQPVWQLKRSISNALFIAHCFWTYSSSGSVIRPLIFSWSVSSYKLVMIFSVCSSSFFISSFV